MRIKLLITLLFCISNIAIGQNLKSKSFVSHLTIERSFIDTLSFVTKWNYPWYIVVNDKGQFENILGDAINGSDTIHLYHTAHCKTNHQGDHVINYCNAKIVEDTIKLIFQPKLPSYGGSLSVSIKDDMFWCDFSANFPLTTDKKLWTVDSQKLVVDKEVYNVGDVIKGYIELNLTETSLVQNNDQKSVGFYFRGFFKTTLTKLE